GSTATVMVLVWTRPRLSLGGTRCQRCPPASSSKAASAPAPVTRSTTTPGTWWTISASKTALRHVPRVNAELELDERLRVIPAFRRADLDDDRLMNACRHHTPLLFSQGFRSRQTPKRTEDDDSNSTARRLSSARFESNRKTVVTGERAVPA